MATKGECKKCINRKECPILLAIKEAAKDNEMLRRMCVSFKEE